MLLARGPSKVSGCDPARGRSQLSWNPRLSALQPGEPHPLPPPSPPDWGDTHPCSPGSSASAPPVPGGRVATCRCAPVVPQRLSPSDLLPRRPGTRTRRPASPLESGGLAFAIIPARAVAVRTELGVFRRVAPASDGYNVDVATPRLCILVVSQEMGPRL